MATEKILDDYHNQVKDVVNFGFGRRNNFVKISIDIDNAGISDFKIYAPGTGWISGQTFDQALTRFVEKVNNLLAAVGCDPYVLPIPIVHDVDLCPPGIMEEDESVPEIVFMLPIDPYHLQGNVYQP